MADNSNSEVHDIAIWFADKADPEDCYRAFEAYGHAMASASTFEQLMALMVMKAFVLRLDKRANANIQPVDKPQLIQSLMNSSYDSLQRKLRNSFTLSNEVVTGLADGKGARDHLAHNFWQGHAVNLLSPEGVDVIASECAVHANHFRLLGRALLEDTGVDANDYIEMLVNAPDRAEKLAGWNALLEEKGAA
jgi:hypothetical protein